MKPVSQHISTGQGSNTIVVHHVPLISSRPAGLSLLPQVEALHHLALTWNIFFKLWIFRTQGSGTRILDYIYEAINKDMNKQYIYMKGRAFGSRNEKQTVRQSDPPDRQSDSQTVCLSDCLLRDSGLMPRPQSI